MTSHRAFNLGEFLEEKPQQSLPESLKKYERELGRFESLCHSLCLRLLRLFALGLKVCEYLARSE